MKIRFLTSVAGMNFAYRVKKDYDLREDIARQFIKEGVAVAVDEPVETAVQPSAAGAEQATAPRQRRRRNAMTQALGLG